MRPITLKDINFIGKGKSPSLSLDDGYSFGLSFFETILVTSRGILVDYHTRRINNSLKSFDIDWQLSDDVVHTLINTYDLKHCGLKIQVSTNNVIASTRPLHYSDDYYNKGASLCLSSYCQSSKHPLICHKSGNYGGNILTFRQKKSAGFDDCLFINEKGHITETCIANVYVEKDNTIYTPPRHDGLLPGVIREYLLDKENIIEKELTVSDLLHADGVFLTNSLVGLVHVSRFTSDDKTINYGHTPLTKAIGQRYFQSIQ